MPSQNKIIVAAAGSGKTTTIIQDAGSDPDCSSLMITYTVNGRDELIKKAYEEYAHVPSHLTIMTWFTFLLTHIVRPYQNLFETSGQRVNGIFFNNGISAQYVGADDIRRHYFSSPGNIYRDKISKFGCEVNRTTGGKPLVRLQSIFDRIFIDEAQDLAGYDLDIVEHLLRSELQTNLVGDPRQATYSTNDGPKYKKYRGAKIIGIFEHWEKKSLCEIKHQNYSHRCVQPICDLADRFHLLDKDTESRNKATTGHDGVFAIRKSDVSAYLAMFTTAPQVLRFNKKTKNLKGDPINFGQSKGMTFERTLIFPHASFKKFFTTNDIEDAGKSVEKIYVALTRARQSVGIVVDDNYKEEVLPIFKL